MATGHAVMIPPGVRHRAVGRMTILNVVVPPFDPADEWFGGDERCPDRVSSLALLLTLAPAASADDFRDLFDGKSLDGWVVEGPAKDKTGRMMWSVEDGRIVCLGEGFGFLRYDRREFSDFTLRVEYRFTPTPGGKPPGNSGLGIRTGRFDPAAIAGDPPVVRRVRGATARRRRQPPIGPRDRVALSVQEPDGQPGAAGPRVEHDRGGVRRHPDHDPAQRPDRSWRPTSPNSRM